MSIKSNLQKFFTNLFYPNMYLSIRQLYLLKKIFGKNKLIVEIGSFYGATTKRLAKGNRVIAIDPFIGDYDEVDGCSKQIINCPQKVIRIFKKNISGKNILWLREKSQDVFKRWKSSIDCLFIDGEHTYEALKQDTKWIGFVREKGFIAFHDACEQFPEVQKYLEDHIVPNYRFVAKRGSLWIFQK